ncbi:hypothetical protein NP233_g10077 [Leucocoprinus birnbaumii]|uniref:Uncharacterized protein n=1 Tax=Leucocoprinus birnbaumii TaxID=56174 RepID=A0AAD5YQ81_9AGAR|nr:hypothetical protein NP233_g10077 [Leucocoprinus birnbaumii]
MSDVDLLCSIAMDWCRATKISLWNSRNMSDSETREAELGVSVPSRITDPKLRYDHNTHSTEVPVDPEENRVRNWRNQLEQAFFTSNSLPRPEVLWAFHYDAQKATETLDRTGNACHRYDFQREENYEGMTSEALQVLTPILIFSARSWTKFYVKFLLSPKARSLEIANFSSASVPALSPSDGSILDDGHPAATGGPG